VAIATLGAALACGCTQATCADYHAPGCWSPPPVIEGDGAADDGDADDGDADATQNVDATDGDEADAADGDAAADGV
jgi:hypothetical protein